MSAAPPPSGRFTELDAFRGLAALAVVIFHYTVRFDQLYGLGHSPPEILRLGVYGVHFFFIISGFVICWSLSRTNGVRGFLLSRISRIYPAYWSALLLTFTVVAVAGLPGREVGVGALLVNLTMLQDYFHVPHVDRAYWTLTIELTFYAWIVLFFLVGQLHRAELLLVPLMLIGVLVNLELITLPSRLRLLMLVDHANQFAAGIVFLRLHQGGSTRVARWLLPLSAAVNFAIYPWVDAAFISLFLVLFLLAVRGRLTWLCRAPLVWLGSVSYSLYLLHQNIGYVVIREVEARAGSALLGAGVALIAMLVLAELLARTVERPAARWLRRRGERHPAARDSESGQLSP